MSLQSMPDDWLPPAYGDERILPAPKSNAKARIITLCHREPGRINKRHRVTAGERIEKLEDVIMFDTTMTFEDMMETMNERTRRRFEISIYGDDTNKGVGVLVLKMNSSSKTICVDDGNWNAAKGLLGSRKAELEFHFAQVPAAWTGPEKKKKLRCVVQ